MIKNDFDLDKVFDNIDFEGNMHKKINNVYLSNNQISILDRYEINYKNCLDVKELMYKIEMVLDECEDEDLENALNEIAEFNYYHNTNK